MRGDGESKLLMRCMTLKDRGFLRESGVIHEIGHDAIIGVLGAAQLDPPLPRICMILVDPFNARCSNNRAARQRYFKRLMNDRSFGNVMIACKDRDAVIRPGCQRLEGRRSRALSAQREPLRSQAVEELECAIGWLGDSLPGEEAESAMERL